MQHKWRNILLLCAMFVFGAQSVTAGDTQASDVANDYAQKWNSAFNSEKIETLGELYSETALVSPGNGLVVTSRSEIVALFGSFIEAGVTNHNVELVRADMQGNAVSVMAKWSASLPDEKGESIEIGGVLSHYLIKGNDGQWRSHSHVWNARQ